ncbi:MAG TPA: DUF6691 family protein [Gemmatimonadales bacterium]|jgi:hypothetical protein|nr:DUF6691 family protein [Gemmatimonadales bacterium]
MNATPEVSPNGRGTPYLRYLLLGTGFGFVLTKAEAISWFRIQEMFRFQSFHMYGIMLSAVLVGMVSIQLIKRFRIRTFAGEPITIEPKLFSWGNVIGGTLFGLGWALTGACPGPLYALVGAGVWVMAVALVAAIAGTWVYGLIRDKLPH